LSLEDGIFCGREGLSLQDRERASIFLHSMVATAMTLFVLFALLSISAGNF